jgi:hypothetical protein
MKTGYDIPLLAQQIEDDIRNWAIKKGYRKNFDSLLSVSIVDEYWSEKLNAKGIAESTAESC